MNTLLISFYEGLDIIGLKYLHYALLGKGYKSSILCLPYFNPENSRQLNEIKNFILKIEPAFLGVSLMSYEYSRASKLTKYIKSFKKDMPIIWGGIHPTIVPGDCLDYADYACRGEGEGAILAIADAVSRGQGLKQINNLCYLENGGVKINPLYPLIENLETIPDYEHIPRNSFILARNQIQPLNKNVFAKYSRHMGRIYSVITSRGCPFSCTYCSNNFISHLYENSKIRRRSVAAVIEGLAKSVRDNPEIEYVNFQDDCFLACSDEYLREFCGTYKAKIGRPFIIRSIPIYITRDKLKSLKDAGISWISLGLQTGSDRVLKDVYKRKSFREDFLKAAKMVKDFNIAAFYDIILDNPFETQEDKLQTIETLMQTPKPFYTQVFSLVFYYGTELYEKAKTECPQYIKEDYREKNYAISHKNMINDLTRLSTFLNEKRMSGLLNLYRKNPGGLKFKIVFPLVKMFAFFLLQPLIYIRIIRLSQRGSLTKTAMVLPIYFKEGLKRYLNQFRGKTYKDANL